MPESDLEAALAFQLRAVNAPPPIREFAFHPERKWRFDFAWPRHRIAVECEGGSWIAGGHSRGKGFEEDCIKYGEAVILGWGVLRVTTDMIADGRAVTLIERALASR